ncbi:MAG: hypothetical protein H6822_06505 [Planctomycetaceae bacterium]|nr:hypothetical protein [Planctomycetaceae bacterium]
MSRSCLSGGVLWLTAFLTISLSIATAKAGDDDGPSTQEKLERLVALGPGVHQIKKDRKGRIISCVVVGQSPISTVLGKAKGVEMARSKADLACSASFVKWLKEEVTVYQTSDGESIILIEGTESADGDTLVESGKAIEKESTKMESVSKGIVRGLQVIHKYVNGEDKTYTLVKGWKADSADGVKKVASDLADDGVESSSGSNKKTSKSKRADKRIESDSATSDDADDFLN